MDIDSKQTTIDRFQTTLHWQLAAQLPRPGGIHKYSHGALYAGYSSKRQVDANGEVTWTITISKGIDYGAAAMGFNNDGTRRKPRGRLETINFKTIDNCVQSVAKTIALPTGGKVVIK
ncbi:MAG: hypothetical protein ACI35W_04030 [Anaeroplasmataceae bacterium]